MARICLHGRRKIVLRNKLIKLRVGDDIKAIRGCTVVVANGQYFAGGMQIAPHARLDDGLLDVVTVGDVGKSELLKMWTTLYNGSHIRHPKIGERKTTTVTIESSFIPNSLVIRHI